jgi:tetratricopeptide (TPR) repeat protein
MEIYNSDKALSMTRRSLEEGATFQKTPGTVYSASEIQAQTEVDLIQNMFETGKMEEAWDAIIRLEKAEADPDYVYFRDRWLLRLKLMKGSVLVDRGDLEGAKAIGQQCLALAKRRGYKKYEGRAVRLLGQTLTAEGAYDRAEEHLRAALTQLEEVGNPKQLWITHSAIARLYSKMNRPDLEREQWQAAKAIVESTADGLEVEILRRTFINATPVRRIMECANL